MNLNRRVPVGLPGGVRGRKLFTFSYSIEHKWIALKDAHITCLDYSMDMLKQAKKRFDGYTHIKCIQGMYPI